MFALTFSLNQHLEGKLKLPFRVGDGLFDSALSCCGAEVRILSGTPLLGKGENFRQSLYGAVCESFSRMTGRGAAAGTQYGSLQGGEIGRFLSDRGTASSDRPNSSRGSPLRSLRERTS